MSEVNLELLSENYENLCRYCLNAENTVYIFKKVDNLEIQLNEEHGILSLSKYIEIKSNDLPNRICLNCVNKIRSWHIFQEQCETTRNILERVKNTFDFIEVKLEVNLEEKSDDEGEKNDNLEVAVESKEDDDSDSDYQGEEPTNESSADGSEESDSDYVEDKALTTNSKKKKRYSYNYQCPVCGKIVQKMKEHMLFHNTPDGKPYSCETCEKSYTTKRALRTHIQNIHLNIRYPCDQCDKVLASKEVLRVHKISNHSGKKFPCPICGRLFRNSSYLYKHRHVHESIKRYPCLEPDCGRAFRANDDLTRHARIHSGEKPFACEICGRCFRLSSLLNKHRDCRHGIKAKCIECNEQFTNKKELKKHNEKVHDGLKKYTCPEADCRKFFTKINRYNEHIRIHSSEKPYVCDICGSTFRMAKHLKRHLQRHENNKCSKCDLQFNNGRLLKKHNKTCRTEDD